MKTRGRKGQSTSEDPMPKLNEVTLHKNKKTKQNNVMKKHNIKTSEFVLFFCGYFCYVNSIYAS